MKYTARSTKYIFKNFFYLLPFVLIPAFFLALSTDKQSIECVLRCIATADFTSMHFEHLFSAISVLNFSSLSTAIFGVLAVITTIVCVSLLMAFLEKHLRIGKRTFNGLFSKLNDYLVPTLFYLAVILFIYEVWAFITATLMFVFSRITLMPLALTLMIVFFLVMNVLLIYVVGIFYLWLPCMQITGFRSLEAFQYSYQMTTHFKWKLLAIQSLVLLFVEALTCVCAFFFADYILYVVCTTVLIALLMTLYCVRMEIAYFDRDNIERADVKPKYKND